MKTDTGKTIAVNTVAVNTVAVNTVAVNTVTKAQRRRKIREGMVIANRMEKTVVVAVVRHYRHQRYGKYVHSTNKYYAHDDKKQCNLGDVVRIVETRPLSKLKRWRVQAVISKAL